MQGRVTRCDASGLNEHVAVGPVACWGARWQLDRTGQCVEVDTVERLEFPADLAVVEFFPHRWLVQVRTAVDDDDLTIIGSGVEQSQRGAVLVHDLYRALPRAGFDLHVAWLEGLGSRWCRSWFGDANRLLGHACGRGCNTIGRTTRVEDRLTRGPVKAGEVVERRDDVAPLGLGEQRPRVRTMTLTCDRVLIDGDHHVRIRLARRCVTQRDLVSRHITAGSPDRLSGRPVHPCIPIERRDDVAPSWIGEQTASV